MSQHEARDRALFNAISARYAQKDLIASSRGARAHRLQETLKSALAAIPQARILELGCGAGFSARYLSGSYGEYVGVDYADELIRYAQEHNAVAGARFQCANLQDLTFKHEFDIAVMIGVLHHLPDPIEALRKIAQFLRPGGLIVANEPQSGNVLISALRAARKTLDPAYSKDQREFSHRELLDMFLAAGLSEVSARAQGLISTPFAEVPLKPAGLFAGIARLGCYIDSGLQNRLPHALLPVAWNVIVQGRAVGTPGGDKTGV
jgi:2-polyprenyl-3-methyl-5-hydroxy-6-metoxy-1,4-benzoquinol methylase